MVFYQSCYNCRTEYEIVVIGSDIQVEPINGEGNLTVEDDSRYWCCNEFPILCIMGSMLMLPQWVFVDRAPKENKQSINYNFSRKMYEAGEE